MKILQKYTGKKDQNSMKISKSYTYENGGIEYRVGIKKDQSSLWKEG